MYIDNIFRIIVYSICLYFICISNITINIIGYIILVSHLYKDITNLKTWPLWCEYCGLGIAFILIKEGYIISNYLIIFMGLLKFTAHIRQIVYNNNKYYY